MKGFKLMLVNFEHYPIVGVTFKLSFEELKALHELKDLVDIDIAVARDYHNHYDANAIAIYMQTVDKSTHQPKGTIRQIGFIAKDQAKAIVASNDNIDVNDRYDLNINTNEFVGNSNTWLSIGKKRDVANTTTEAIVDDPLPTNPFL